jgi:hypothetical protein
VLVEDVDELVRREEEMVIGCGSLLGFDGGGLLGGGKLGAGDLGGFGGAAVRLRLPWCLRLVVMRLVAVAVAVAAAASVLASLRSRMRLETRVGFLVETVEAIFVGEWRIVLEW